MQMTLLEFTSIVLLVSGLAGFLGALTGLGGGVVVTPALTLLLGVDLRYAIGASLVSVIATSSGAAAAYVREGYSNIRIGMLLEIATTLGAVLGAALAGSTPTAALAIIFGIVLLHAAWQSIAKPRSAAAPSAADPLAIRLRLNGVYPAPSGPIFYQAQKIKSGMAVMFGALPNLGFTGHCSGALKVIAMDQVMRLPFKVSTTTSNFMIGVTAPASAGVYLRHGWIDPGLAMPVMLGVLAGSILGARGLMSARTRALRLVFAVVVGAMAVEMLVGGITGRL